MKKRIFLASLIFAAVLTTSMMCMSMDGAKSAGKKKADKNGAAPAQIMGKGGNGMPGGMMGPGMMGNNEFGMFGGLISDLKFVKDIGLSDAQISKLKKIRSDAMKSNIKIKAELDILNIELKELLDEEKLDRGDIDSKIDAISKKEADLQKLFLHAFMDAKAVLTKEQIEKLEKILNDEKGKMDRGGFGGGGFPGMGMMQRGMGDGPEMGMCPRMMGGGDGSEMGMCPRMGMRGGMNMGPGMSMMRRGFGMGNGMGMMGRQMGAFPRTGMMRPGFQPGDFYDQSSKDGNEAQNPPCPLQNDNDPDQ